MSASHGPNSSSNLTVVLAWLLVPIPLVAFPIAWGRLDDVRMTDAQLFLAPGLAGFAACILVFACINAIAISTRIRTLGESPFARTVLIATAANLLFAVGWITCVVIGLPALFVEPVFAFGICIATMVTFVFATARQREQAVLVESPTWTPSPRPLLVVSWILPVIPFISTLIFLGVLVSNPRSEGDLGYVALVLGPTLGFLASALINAVIITRRSSSLNRHRVRTSLIVLQSLAMGFGFILLFSTSVFFVLSGFAFLITPIVAGLSVAVFMIVIRPEHAATEVEPSRRAIRIS